MSRASSSACFLPLGRQVSGWALGLSAATSSLSALETSFPFQRVSFRRGKHWSSVLGGPIHASLAWGIGRAVGDTFPWAASGLGLHPLSWEQLSLGLGMSFLPGSRPRPCPGQRDLLASCLVPVGVRAGGGGQGQNLASLGKGSQVPIAPHLQSEGRTDEQ